MRAKTVLVTTLILLSVLALGAGQSLATAPGGAPGAATSAGSSTLVGSRGGTFWYQQVAYPGDVLARVTMTFYPADPVAARGVGFNVYGADGFHLGAGASTLGGPVGTIEWSYESSAANTLTVQVYNYIEGLPVTFSLAVEGLVGAAAPGASSTPRPARSAVIAGGAPIAGSLWGLWIGAFHRYEVVFPSAEAVTLVMTYAPDDRIIAKRVGFLVYGPRGQVAASAGSFGRAAATFAPVPGTKYLVQVYNYVDHTTIGYTIAGATGVRVP